MKKHCRPRKRNLSFETLQLERALKRIAVHPTEDMHCKELHELTFEEFKAMYAVGALELTRFNRLMHWEKFLYKVYVRGIIQALEKNLDVPLHVLNSNQYQIPKKYFRPFLKSKGLKHVPFDCFIKREVSK